MTMNVPTKQNYNMEGDENNLNKNTSSDLVCPMSANGDAGIVWERLSIGYRIEDLRTNRFTEALELAEEIFFTSEPMCKATLLAKDKTSSQTYIQLISAWINEMRSMCAIHEGTGKLVGIIVATVNEKADLANDSSRIRVSQGEAIFKIQSLKSCVFGAARIYEKYEINEYFRLQVLCVDTAFSNRGIGSALVRSCVECHRRLQLPTCIGVFSSGAAQTIADRLGFETLAEFPYREYVPLDKTEKPFVDVGLGNYSIACMGLRSSVPTIMLETVSRSISMTSSSKKKKTNSKTKDTYA